MEKHNRFMAELRKLLDRYKASLEVDGYDPVGVRINYGDAEYPAVSAEGDLAETPDPDWPEIPTTNEIQAYLHCRYCLAEFQAGVPEARGKSPKEYADTQAGWTKQGLQVWCNRHEVNLIHMDFGGNKVRANTEGDPLRPVAVRLEGEEVD